MPNTDYIPSPADVADHNTSRTRTKYGRLLGVFSDATTPTDAQVERVIAKALLDVSDMIGDDIPQALWDDAANLVALKAAMQIELDYFSEQISSGRSIYAQLEKEYESSLIRVQKEVTEAVSGIVTDTGPSNRPSWSFPAASNWLTRRM